MRTLKNYRLALLIGIIAAIGGRGVAQTQPIQHKRLYKKPYKGNASRPQMPAYNDYLTLESGEYNLTVTLVDERIYEGSLEINANIEQ